MSKLSIIPSDFVLLRGDSMRLCALYAGESNTNTAWGIMSGPFSAGVSIDNDNDSTSSTAIVRTTASCAPGPVDIVAIYLGGVAFARAWVSDLDLTWKSNSVVGYDNRNMQVSVGKENTTTITKSRSVGMDIEDRLDIAVSQTSGATPQLESLTLDGDPWPDPNRRVAKIDGNQVIAEKPGAALIKATLNTPSGFSTGYMIVRCGTLMVYGVDGQLYQVQAGSWTHTRVSPPTGADAPSGFPSFASMNPPSPTPPVIGKYVPKTDSYVFCYVLNPSALKSQ